MAKRIMIVDDTEENLKIAETALEKEGYDVDTYQDPNDGLREIRREGEVERYRCTPDGFEIVEGKEIDLVITDLMFPSGYVKGDLLDQYGDQIRKARRFLRDNRYYPSVSERSRRFGAKPPPHLRFGEVEFNCGFEWRDEDYLALLEGGLETDQGFEKSVGTVLFEAARDSGLETVLVSSMHRHGFVQKGDPDFRQLVLPLMIRFQDLAVSKEHPYCNIGFNRYYLRSNAKKQNEEYWQDLAKRITEPEDKETQSLPHRQYRREWRKPSVKVNLEDPDKKSLGELVQEAREILSKEVSCYWGEARQMPKVLGTVVDEGGRKGFIAVGKTPETYDPSMSKIEIYSVTTEGVLQGLGAVSLGRGPCYQKFSNSFFKVDEFRLSRGRLELEGELLREYWAGYNMALERLAEKKFSIDLSE